LLCGVPIEGDCMQSVVAIMPDLVLIWFWFGSDLLLIWFWFGSDLVLIWFWFGSDLVLIWFWFGSGWSFWHTRYHKTCVSPEGTVGTTCEGKLSWTHRMDTEKLYVSCNYASTNSQHLKFELATWRQSYKVRSMAWPGLCQCRNMIR